MPSSAVPVDDGWSDAELLAAAAGGDGGSFAAFYRRHLAFVVSWCLRETGDRELAADLASEVFAAALVSVEAFRPERGDARAWLFGIAQNKVRESRRRGRIENAARRRLDLPRVALDDRDLERVDDLASSAGDLEALLAVLTPEQRAAVNGRVVDERGYADLARELRCSESVLRQRVSRGLATLRARLEEK